MSTQRHALLGVLQEHYGHFEPFLEDVMEFLGFQTTEIQKDIGNFMEFGPQRLMIQAQRSQAKTTIAAAFAVWSLIHQPWYRILIISAGGSMASDISTLIVRIVLNMPGLECLRPDRQAGDRTSAEKFDIHYSLKGVEKSASVSCVGITANLQGRRADVLLADDVESAKNARTAPERAKLLELTKDFTSIVQSGRILWLGTPQTSTSIYTSLPARGVQVRIWPGRYPTPEQRTFYGDKLAPLLARRLEAQPSLGAGGGLLKDQGQPIDPVLLGEVALQDKELDQGTPYFQLQHMLCTALTDALRFPLKPEKLVVMDIGEQRRVPVEVTRGMGPQATREFYTGDFSYKLSTPHALSPEVLPLGTVFAYIDPAPGGKNGDETGYAIGAQCSGNIYLLAAGGIPGGYDVDKLDALTALMKQYRVGVVVIEKNMGFGAFREVWTPLLLREHQCSIEDDLVSGKKEARIINTLAPIIGRGSLIVDADVPRQDEAACRRHAASNKTSYSLFFQLAHMSEDSNALVHDDRVDSLEGLCRWLQRSLGQDPKKLVAEAQRETFRRLTSDVRGRYRVDPKPEDRARTFTNLHARLGRRN